VAAVAGLFKEKAQEISSVDVKTTLTDINSTISSASFGNALLHFATGMADFWF
jgi:hypothetical protein